MYFCLADTICIMSNPTLSINNLHASIGDKLILEDISFSIGAGELHVLMGPNGSGKSTLARAVMGDTSIIIHSGIIEFCGEDITHAPPDVRAKKGLFLGFQHPVEVAGVGQIAFMRSVLINNEKSLASGAAFNESLVSALERAGLPVSFLDRNVNEGFSGGEKKRNEMFQLAVFNPRMAIMDEVDSGLDVDGARMAGEYFQNFVSTGKSLFLITHSGAIARALNPHGVYIMKGGRIVERGSKDLLRFVEERGFETL